MVKKIGDWIELEKETVYDNPWIQVTESKVLNPNGGQGIYGVVHFKNLAIGVIPIDHQGYTWLVGQHRYPLNGKLSWEIIEGGGPLGIDPLESAKRELKEEAGITATKWELIQEMELSNSATDEIALIYLARDLIVEDAQPEEAEQLELRKLSFKEAYEMVLSGEIKDSLSVAGILRLNDTIQKEKAAK